MTHANKTLAKALILTTTACAFAFGAASAYAADENSAVTAEAVQSQIWVHEKTAVSENPSVIRVSQPIPDMVVPLNTDFKIDTRSSEMSSRTYGYDKDVDLQNFDLVEDSPLFIGAKTASEFDTRDALTDSGAYPHAMGVDPLYTVAGAGLSTSF